jgi:hypothetical protein
MKQKCFYRAVSQPPHREGKIAGEYIGIMSAIEFLRKKGVLGEHQTQWIVSFSDGRKIDLVEVFEEYAALRQPLIIGEIPLPDTSNSEHTELMRKLYPKDNSKRFRR